MKYSPSRFCGKGPQVKYVIVSIDVMSGFVWAAPLMNKEPPTVEAVLRRLLSSMDRKPALISSDTQIYMTGQVTDLLDKKGITHRSKSDAHDMNALSVIDRAIQNIKRTLVEKLAN